MHSQRDGLQCAGLTAFVWTDVRVETVALACSIPGKLRGLNGVDLAFVVTFILIESRK